MAHQAPNGKERVIVPLVGEDGNSFAILGRCTRAMRRAGWTQEEIEAFREAATSGDYNHLLATVLDYVDEPAEEEEEEEEPWYPGQETDEQVDLWRDPR